MAMHSHHPHNHDPDTDWAVMAADVTREGEVLMPYLTETVSWIAALCRHDGLEVRRVVDIGSGPGVGTCVLAQQFDLAVVTAVDGSREMLECAEARARALGLSARVQTRLLDIPEGLGQIRDADLVWVAMVLHHIDDLAATFHGIRSRLEPGGFFAIAEFGDPLKFLPDDLGVGHPGLRERLGDVNPADHFPSVDFPAMLKAAGFELVADRMAEVRLDPPLAEDARGVILGYLGRVRQLMEDRLDAQDHETLDVLMDEGSPLGIMRREDAFLHASRHIYVARAAA